MPIVTRGHRRGFSSRQRKVAVGPDYREVEPKEIIEEVDPEVQRAPMPLPVPSPIPEPEPPSDEEVSDEDESTEEEEVSDVYDCTECETSHRKTSKKGKKHLGYAK